MGRGSSEGEKEAHKVKMAPEVRCAYNSRNQKMACLLQKLRGRHGSECPLEPSLLAMPC